MGAGDVTMDNTKFFASLAGGAGLVGGMVLSKRNPCNTTSRFVTAAGLVGLLLSFALDASNGFSAKRAGVMLLAGGAGAGLGGFLLHRAGARGNPPGFINKPLAAAGVGVVSATLGALCAMTTSSFTGATNASFANKPRATSTVASSAALAAGAGLYLLGGSPAQSDLGAAVAGGALVSLAASNGIVQAQTAAQ